MAAAVSTIPSLHIHNAHWESFKNYINEHYPENHFTSEQKDFVKKSLLQDNGQCSDINRLWVTFFSQNLMEYIDSAWSGGGQSVSDQLEVLQTITGKAILGFFNYQNMIRHQVAPNERNAQHTRMLEIHPNIVNFPVELSLDMGRYFNLHKPAKGGGPNISDVDGEHLFRILHNKVQQMKGHAQGGNAGQTEQGATSSTGEKRVHGSISPEGEWYPHSIEDTYLRLCTYKVWCDKYEQENDWSPRKMVDEWLKEAIHLYNTISYHWPSCETKQYSDKQFHAIRHTAVHSWLHDVANRAGFSTSVRKPATNWISDWHTAPVTEKRHEWETYFCHVIFNAKNMARLLNVQERVPQEIIDVSADAVPTGAVSEGDQHAHKKAKHGGEGEASLVQDVVGQAHGGQMPTQSVVSLVRHLEKRLEKMENHSQQRHHELMRELVGHFHPIRNHLLHLNQGQHHLHAMIDRLSK